MRLIDIEAWARRVIDAVLAGAKQEDSRVELKAQWPADFNKCARRVAGHCNAARGTPVLWLIGVDEGKRAVPGVDGADFASWWPKVKQEFAQDAPVLREFNFVGPGGSNVVALYFESDRAPFVVKNAANGGPNGGPVEREVPWREGTSVRSATRADLLRLLLPLQALPTFEIMEARAMYDPDPRGTATTAHLLVYASMPMNASAVFPSHMAHLRMSTTGGLRLDLKTHLEAQSTSSGGGLRAMNTPTHVDHRLHTILQGDAQIIMQGPGFFRIRGSHYPDEPLDEALLGGPAHLEGALAPVGVDFSIPFEAHLDPGSPKPTAGSQTPRYSWSFNPTRG